MKNLARSNLWWPYLDSDIESVVKECTTCQHKLKSPSEAPLHPWEWPNEPWGRLHIDYAGPIHNLIMLIIVDSHSKWIDVHVTTSSNASVTIEKLMSSFATHGLPHTIVSDNGPCFVSSEFELFNKMNGIRHIIIYIIILSIASSPSFKWSSWTCSPDCEKWYQQDGRRKPIIESNAVLRKISHYSTDNNGNLTFSTPDEETDPIPTGFGKSYPMQESVGYTKQTEDASRLPCTWSYIWHWWSSIVTELWKMWWASTRSYQCEEWSSIVPI